jgi:hypothetical protein
MRKARIKAASLAKRITSVGIPGFVNVGWKPLPDDRESLRKLIIVLEDKRALYIERDREIPDYVRMSLAEIRKAITDTMKEVSEDSPALESLRVMRSACASFDTKYGHLDWHHRHEYDGDFFIQLGMLRSIFGHQIAILGYLYGIDIGKELEGILPPSS